MEDFSCVPYLHSPVYTLHEENLDDILEMLSCLVECLRAPATHARHFDEMLLPKSLNIVNNHSKLTSITHKPSNSLQDSEYSIPNKEQIQVELAQ